MIRMLHGDCRAMLASLADNSVHCCVTSPPYYGLRDYGTAAWHGGDPACPHVIERRNERLMLGSDGTLGRNCTSWTTRDVMPKPGQACRCGATRADRQLGLEETPDDYLATMVAVFREIRRVLRDDGTCWVNMGDSYNTYAGNRGASKSLSANVNGAVPDVPAGSGLTVAGLGNKQLLMMPARLALALQADGWWLRSDIIWHKPNPMPESVTDRPTNAHEHVFLLTKRARYFYDAEAVREPAEWSGKMPDGWASHAGAHGTVHRGGRETGRNNGAAGSGRNIRNVWTIPTEAFPGAHFATFPTALAERCIRAGTSERGCCAACGAPWVRVVQRERTRDGKPLTGSFNNGDGYKIGATGVGHWRDQTKTAATGWAPGCACNAWSRPCTVLDPFAGAGTVGLVADRLQRDAILIELKPEYTALARTRLVADAPLFAEVAD